MAVVMGATAAISLGGTPIAMADEAMTDSGDHQTFQITNTAKRAIDPDTALHCHVNGSGSPADPASYTVDAAAGKVTFAAPVANPYTVTFTGAYIPLATLPESFEVDAEWGRAEADVRKFGDVAERSTPSDAYLKGNISTRHPLKTNITIGGGNVTLFGLLANESVFIVINLDGGATAMRGWIRYNPSANAKSGPEAQSGKLAFKGVVRTLTGRTERALFNVS